MYGLLSVAQEADVEAITRGGANIWPYPAALPMAEDPCATGTSREKAVPDAITLPAPFPSWTAYLGDICTGVSEQRFREMQGKTNAAFAARIGFALERQLVNAEFAAAPHLGDDNVTLLNSGGATAAAVAVAFLEDAIAQTAQDGVIHVTPAVVGFLGGNHFRDDRGTLRTTRGTPVAVGAGYVGSDTPTSGGTPDTAAGVGQSWLYATGPVMYRLGAQIILHPETITQALDRSDNTVVYRAEQDAWVAWDTQLQAAVLADWSP
jgi:hypothetical protein